MKKSLLPSILGSFLLLLFGLQSNLAQEKKTSKIQITITEEGKVTSDTTFELEEGQDPEIIKKVVAYMAGGEIHPGHMSKEMHISHSGDHKMMMHKHMMNGINIDSIKEAHPDARVLVIKDENGKITVEESDGDIMKEHKVIILSDGDCEGKEK
jgi:hypothetical protein